ncbi:MAG: restriction endonuclease [Acidobacteria bacterium]|nr:restriction endonuclease [Acidobacteriota bacterium]MBI3421370.1 restriction endonuclease [Acidobacteriota bacterium]
MKVAGTYSFKNGEKVIAKRYPRLLDEVLAVIKQVHAPHHKSKVSKEKTMPGRALFSPRSLNKSFKAEFAKFAWSPVRVPCQYSEQHYSADYENRLVSRGAFREMDFVKEKLGVEVQFGKYAFMVYNVCAKMTIFHNLGHINLGIEIVPVKAFAEEMSTGVSYFEQFIWDLEHRGVSDIDIPVLILGIDS